MTDKQIIIDGIDVSGCPYYNYINKDGSCFSQDCECVKCIHNECFYKDYKRKEQECEELKIYIESNEQQVKEVETLVMDNDRLINELDQLKAENDKYSLFIEKLCDYAGLECNNEEQAMRTLSDLASQMNKARWIIDRYKQTLTEIKKIIEQGVKIHDDIIVSKQILQKLSEVLPHDNQQ